jgi:hypothetical protein
MKAKVTTLVTIAMSLFLCSPAFAEKRCSTQSIAGNWMFATGIGRQSLGPPFPEGKDITALGILHFDRMGNLTGEFDVTVEDFLFFPNNTVTGTVAVNADCTGTLTFVTSAGTARTDSIVVVNRREMQGMTQDPANLWTYQMKRLSNDTTKGDDD